jgi:hypothetical protein
VSSHRARGFGRYVALRTAAPRHAAGSQARRTGALPRIGSRRPGPVYLVAGVLSLLGLSLIGLRVAQVESTPRASGPPPRITLPAPVLSMPAPYRPKWSTARAVRQAAKRRPPVLLGRPGPEALTRYCRHLIGPLGQAVPDGGDWICRSLSGVTKQIRIGRACRFLYDDRAWGVPGDTRHPRCWRCYRDGP